MDPNTNVPPTVQPTQPGTVPPANNTPTAPMTPNSGRQEQAVYTQPQGKSKKKLLFIGLAIIAALMIAAVGTILWANNAKNKYITAVSNYESRAKAAYDYFGGLTQRLTHGQDIQKKFNDTLATAPKEPTLLGKSLAPADKVKRVNELTDTMRTFETEYVAAAHISDYSEKALHSMESASITIRTLDDLKAAQTKLQQAREDLAALSAPKDVQDFHSRTLAAYDTVISDCKDAIASVSDPATYNTVIDKLASDVEGIRPKTAQQELAGIFNDAYGKADTAYDKLQDTLGVE